MTAEKDKAKKQFELALVNILTIGRLVPSPEPSDQHLVSNLLEVVGSYLSRAPHGNRVRIVKLLNIVMNLRLSGRTIIDIAAARSEAWRWQANGREDVSNALLRWADEAGAENGTENPTPAV